MPGKAAWMGMNLPFEGEGGPETRAGAFADRDVPTCGLNDEVCDVADRLPDAGPCVVVEDRLVMGLLEEEALAERSRTAAEAMSRGPSTFRPSLPIDELAHYLDRRHLARALITTLDGRLVGLVRREDLGG